MHVETPWTGTHSLVAIEEIAKLFRDHPRLMKVTLIPEWADPEAHDEHDQKQMTVVVHGLPWLMYAFRPMTDREPASAALATRPPPAPVVKLQFPRDSQASGT